MFQIVYILTKSPFEEPIKNYIEVLNETVLYFICLLYFGFTDYSQNDSMHESIGWVVITILTFGLMVNLIINSLIQAALLR